MLYKYVVSGTPTTKEDFRQDVAKLLSGELSNSNLSTNCDQALSGFVAGESKPSTYFTIEVNDATDSILKRPHSVDGTKTIWLDVRTNADDQFKLCSLGDGTGGVRTNPDYQYTLVNIGYCQVYTFLVTGTVIYIAMNDWGVFTFDAVGNSLAFNVELRELYPNIPAASYANSDPSTVWNVSSYYVGVAAINTPYLVGANPNNLLATKNVLLADFGHTSNVEGTYTDSSEIPALLPDGTAGIPLHLVQGSFNQAQESPRYWQLGELMNARYDQLQSLYGLRLTGSDVGNVLVTNTQRTMNSTQGYYVFFIKGL